VSIFRPVRERRRWLQGGPSGAVATLYLIACASGTHRDEPQPASSRPPPSTQTQSTVSAPEPVLTQTLEPPAADPSIALPELNVAAYAGRIADVRKLLAAKVAIDARDSEGTTALMAALRKYSSEPTTNAGSARRTDPKNDPRTKRKLQIAMLLIDRGADVTLANALGFTALHYAASFPGDDKAIRALIDSLIAHGASVNQPTDPKYARTPLELALDQLDSGRVARLLEHGANPNQTTYEGKTLADIAEERGNPAVGQLLRDARANPRPAAATKPRD
jgi:ankyrin repeat protein